jgi:hypothetical protein
MIFIVPSELRETSNLLKYISDVDYRILPGLEQNTGADLMVSPDCLPLPRNDKFLQLHIDNGAVLDQYKFGHDLPGSIVDGRLNEALARMQATGAMISQCRLTFVGLLGYDNYKGYATINGQLSYGKHPMKWIALDTAIRKWIARGGSYHPLASGKQIPLRLVGIQKDVNEFYAGNTTKRIIPVPPKTTKIIEPTNEYLRKWKVAQRIEPVDDLRRMLKCIPGTRIGDSKVNAIWQYMEDNGIRQDFGGFADMLIGPKPEILKVKGIGKTLVNQMQLGLWHTREERERRNK